MGFYCKSCGKEHEGLPLDIGFAKPSAVFDLLHALFPKEFPQP
jgi:hypothetical protein